MRGIASHVLLCWLPSVWIIQCQGKRCSLVHYSNSLFLLIIANRTYNTTVIMVTIFATGEYTLCLKKTSPSYNSRKHCRIFIIFGRNISKKARNQNMLNFSTSPN